MTPSSSNAQSPDSQAALAAWESATVQNLNPLLSIESADALWGAIMALRASGDAAAFGDTARAIVASAAPFVRDTMDRAIASLPDLTVRAAPAAPAAKE